jgi:hypothetical protein
VAAADRTRPGVCVDASCASRWCPHAHQTVAVDVDETRICVLDHHETILTVMPCTAREVIGHKAYRHTTGCRACKVSSFN